MTNEEIITKIREDGYNPWAYEHGCERCRFGMVYESSHEWLSCHCEIYGKAQDVKARCKEFVPIDRLMESELRVKGEMFEGITNKIKPIVSNQGLAVCKKCNIVVWDDDEPNARYQHCPKCGREIDYGFVNEYLKEINNAER